MKTKTQIMHEVHRLQNELFNSWVDAIEFKRERMKGKIEALAWVLKDD